MLLIRLAVLFGVISVLSVAYAASAQDLIGAELSSRFPGARIALVEDIHWVQAPPNSDAMPVSVVISEPNARGQVQFTLQNKVIVNNNEILLPSYGWVAFQALQKAYIAHHRVMPGEEIKSTEFSIQEVNVASGGPHEYRGVILDPKTEISQLEARQTILEGQPLLSTAVQKTPDVRKGDVVRVEIISNGLTLSTQAMASEPAYMNGRVRVLTDKTKRELAGKLIAAGLVEVKL